MADSLVVANSIDLLGGVVSEIPSCAGAVFRLAPGYDLGAPQPTTDFVASLILDGERPFGRRSSNRTIKLPVVITAPTRLKLAAAREVLEQAIDQDRWTLTWTRDDGAGDPLPLLIDCFRAYATNPGYDLIREHQLIQALLLTIPALPYGRADTQVRVAFTSPVPSAPPPPPAAVTLDTFTAISSTRHYQSQRCVIGPQSLCWDPDDDRVGDPGGHNSTFTYAADLSVTQNLAGLTSLQMYLGLGSRYWHALEYHGHIHGAAVYVTLTDASGNDLHAERKHLRLPVSPVWGAPAFTRVTMPIPLADPAFDYTAVVSYEITIVNRHHPRRLAWVTAYLDNLTAQPPSVQATPVTRGSVFTLHAVQGTARSPMSLSFIQPPSAGSPTTVTSAGVGNYTVPGGTAWLRVEAVGGGGAGGTRTTAGVGGGGSGAEYAREDVFPASAGDVIPYSVGAGGTPGATPVDGAATVFGPGPDGSLVVTANGGISAQQNSTTGPAGGSGSSNTVHHDGGAGRTASGSVGGGGGGSGGSALAGLTPTGTAADVRTATGAGTWTCPAGVTQVYAECWGPGGSGGTGNSGNGAGGGGGEYAAGYVAVTPGNTYNYSIAAGGAAVTGTALDGNPGAGNTWFTGDGGATVTAHPGQAGRFRTYSGGGGAGGTGSTNTVHRDGGPGGSAMPYSGGGGSSAGPGAAGNAGDGYGHPGTAPTDGGAGGAGTGANAGASGTAGVQPGGGGGGTYSGHTSGKGGDGKLRLTYPGGAPTNNGASAVTGGGAGGNGGATTGTAGAAGSQPGGGGGGGNSAGTTVAGGNGGAGKLTITPYASQPFKQLIAHRPPLGAPKTFQPLVSVGAGAEVPNGATQYTMPQPVTGVNAGFGGTYTVYLIAYSWSGGSSSSTPRSIYVTVNQYEYAGGPSTSVATQTISVAPNQVVNNLVTAGVLTLPIRQVPDDNTAAYYTVSVTDSQTADRFLEVIFLDTMGQTIVCNDATGYITRYADGPDPDTGLGLLLGTQTDRTAATSTTDGNTALTGGPLHVEPSEGDNLLFVYSADGSSPNVSVSYYPSFFYDRIT